VHVAPLEGKEPLRPLKRLDAPAGYRGAWYGLS
jgi:hypothetical protein